MSKYISIESNKINMLNDTKYMSKKMLQKDVDYMCITIKNLIKYHQKKLDESLTNKFIDECINKIKVQAMKGKTELDIRIYTCNDYDYFFKEFNDNYHIDINLLFGKKEYSNECITQAFNMLNPDTEKEIIVRVIDTHFNYEYTIDCRSVTEMSSTLCLATYLNFDNVKNILHSVFPNIEIEIYGDDYLPTIWISFKWH